jgi:hypothetical protein
VPEPVCGVAAGEGVGSMACAASAAPPAAPAAAAAPEAKRGLRVGGASPGTGATLLPPVE